MMAKSKNTTWNRVLALALALALCTAFLVLYPARAAAAGYTDRAVYVGGGGGGGAGGGADPGSGTPDPGMGGDGGTNGWGDDLVDDINRGKNGIDRVGGAGGLGIDGGLYIDGSTTGVTTDGGAGGVGGVGAADTQGGNGNAGGGFGTATLGGGYSISGDYGTLSAMGGYGGNAGAAGGGGTISGGSGGTGGNVYLALANDFTATELSLQGGKGGTRIPATGSESARGGAAGITAGGPLSLDRVTVRGGENPHAGDLGGQGGDASFYTQSPLTVRDLFLAGGETAGGAATGGSATVTVEAPLEATTITVQSGIGASGGTAALAVAGLASVGSLTLAAADVSGSVKATASLMAGLTVPAGQTTSLFVGTKTALTINGGVAVEDGATLYMDASGGGAITLNGGNFTMGKGATLVVKGDVTLNSVNVVDTLSGPSKVDVSLDYLPLQRSTNFNSVTSVTFANQTLTRGEDYTVSGTEISILSPFLYRQAMGRGTVHVTLGNGQQLNHTVTLYDTTPPSFTFAYSDTVAFDYSLDSGATWKKQNNGGAFGTADAAAQGSFLLRQTSGFLMVMDPAQTALSGNIQMDDTADLAWLLTMRDAGGGALHGTGIFELGFVPMPNTYGALTPDYGGGTAFAGTGTVLLCSTRQTNTQLEIAGVVFNDTLLQNGIDWTVATEGGNSPGPYAVRLSEAFLNTLDNGTYTVQLVLTDHSTNRSGYAQGSFAVASQHPPPAPQPGDTASTLLWAMATLVAGGLGGTVALLRWRKNK